jgi:hypothetical protein
MSSTVPPRKTRFACVFRDPFVREQIDPRIQALWKAEYGVGAPFGDLRRTWRKEHCATINPYGSEGCPYEAKDCAMAFLAAVQSSIGPNITRPAGYFCKVARSTGIVRADNKPLTRDRKLGTDVLPKATPQAQEPRRQPGRSGEAERGAYGHPAGPVVGVAGERDIPGLFALDTDQRKSLYRARARPRSIGSLLGQDHDGARERPAPRRAEGEE